MVFFIMRSLGNYYASILIIQKYNLKYKKLLKIILMPEHVHVLFSLPSSKALENIAKSLKGESSNWINDNNFIPTKFKWQRGYRDFQLVLRN